MDIWEIIFGVLCFTVLLAAFLIWHRNRLREQKKDSLKRASKMLTPDDMERKDRERARRRQYG